MSIAHQRYWVFRDTTKRSCHSSVWLRVDYSPENKRLRVVLTQSLLWRPLEAGISQTQQSIDVANQRFFCLIQHFNQTPVSGKEILSASHFLLPTPTILLSLAGSIVCSSNELLAQSSWTNRFRCKFYRCVESTHIHETKPTIGKPEYAHHVLSTAAEVQARGADHWAER